MHVFFVGSLSFRRSVPKPKIWSQMSNIYRTFMWPILVKELGFYQQLRWIKLVFDDLSLVPSCNRIITTIKSPSHSNADFERET